MDNAGVIDVEDQAEEQSPILQGFRQQVEQVQPFADIAQHEANLTVTPRVTPRPRPRRSVLTSPVPSAIHTDQMFQNPANFAQVLPRLPTARHPPCYNNSLSLSKWKLSYDGHTCVRDFFVSLDECIAAYDVQEEYVVRRFHEVLSGHALKFYRSIRNDTLTLSNIKEIFIRTFGPVDFDDTTERELRNMKQKANQPIREFLIEVRALNSKLALPLSDRALLPIIKFNLHPRYALCLSTNRISDLDTLLEIATNFEAYDHPTQKAFSREHLAICSTSNNVSVASTSALCPKCDKPGHSYRSCPNIPGQICFKCKRHGFLTRDCPVCSKPQKN